MDIVFATGNAGKLREASEILSEGFRLMRAADKDVFGEIPETGDTLAANSRQKADYVWERCGADCFADDTGLEIDALGGAPGVHTARYAGEGRDFNANIDKVLAEMAAIERDADIARKMGLHMRDLGRKARFKCVVTLIFKGEEHQFEGVLEGRIALARSGNGGFGYDPVFIPDEYPDRTLADISEEEKNAISHRGKALRKMAAWLAAYQEPEAAETESVTKEEPAAAPKTATETGPDYRDVTAFNREQETNTREDEAAAKEEAAAPEPATETGPDYRDVTAFNREAAIDPPQTAGADSTVSAFIKETERAAALETEEAEQEPEVRKDYRPNDFI